MPTLLLADASPTIQRLIELTFAREDVRVIAVGDGEQAIARITAECPDIVLVDTGAPGRSGYEVCAFVKRQPESAHVPVLLMAGAFEPVDESRASLVGCDGILMKPFEPPQLVARVRELLGGAKGAATHVAAGVPRPLERLAPRPPVEPPSTAVAEGVASGVTVAESTPGSSSLDDYFERLDAAMSARGAASPPPISMTRMDNETPSLADVPTLESILGDAGPIDLPLGIPSGPAAALHMMTPPIEPADAAATLTPTGIPDLQKAQPMEQPPNDGRSPIADAFTALLAVELGEPGASAVRLTTAPAEPVVSDALVEAVTRRVLERIGPDAATRVVADVVAEVAERLVRDEIARIREKK